MTNIFNRFSETLKRRRLRRNASEVETILWSCLRKKALGNFKFRRQYGIGRYVVDFYCPSIKLVIEVDGDSHFSSEAQEYDRLREVYILSLGIKIIRFTNLEIQKNIDGVISRIAEELPRLTPPSRHST